MGTFHYLIDLIIYWVYTISKVTSDHENHTVAQSNITILGCANNKVLLYFVYISTNYITNLIILSTVALTVIGKQF